MVCVTLILLSVILAACSSGGNSSKPEDRPESNGPPESAGDEITSGMEASSPETTGPDEEPSGGSRVEQLGSEAPGQGPKRPRLLLASSAADLSRAVGTRIPDAGAGTYLAVFWGEKPTGGYSVKIQSVRVAGDRATVRLSLKDPPPDAMLTQALTYPYAVAVVRGEGLRGRDIHLEDQKGRRLDWPVREAD
jgi:hypothetical protein